MKRKINRKRAVKIAMGVFGTGQRRKTEDLLEKHRRDLYKDGEPFCWREVLKEMMREYYFLASAMEELDMAMEEREKLLRVCNCARQWWITLEVIE